jgi:hypothetical protein
MGKKNAPVWQMLDIPEPPIVNGFWDYGVVYDPARDGRPSRWENLRSDTLWSLWSYMYWGKKVRKGIESARADGIRHPLHGTVLALVWLTDTLYRRLSPHLEG